MTQVLTLTTPLMRRTVGFDRFNDLFERISEEANNSSDNYPPYNIEKLGEDEYRITMAVSGFTMDDLEIVLHDGELSISGAIQELEADNNATFLHRGIAMRSFQKAFSLADYIQVTGAEMKDGLLIINLVREVPEEKKPRMIPINGDGKKAITNRSSKK